MISTAVEACDTESWRRWLSVARPSKDMRVDPGGEFLMGSEDFYPEERPVRRVEVDGFWIDEHPVTAS